MQNSALRIILVGPAGFEPTTFTQEQLKAILYGFLLTAPEIRHSPSGVSKPVRLLSGARRHTCLDYDPTSRHEANKKTCNNKNLFIILS